MAEAQYDGPMTRSDLSRALTEVAAERDKLVAGLEAEVRRYRKDATDERWFGATSATPAYKARALAKAAAYSQFADRLQQLLNTYRGGTDGDEG